MTLAGSAGNAVCGVKNVMDNAGDWLALFRTPSRPS